MSTQVAEVEVTTTPLSQKNEQPTFEGFSTHDGERQEAEKDKAVAKTPQKPASDDEKQAKTTDDTPETASENASDAPKPHRSAQTRINRAVAAQRQAERERDDFRRQASTLEQRLASIEARLSPNGDSIKDIEAEPKPEVYEAGEFDPQYHRDVAAYAARQEFAKLNAQSAKQQQAQQRGQASQEFMGKLGEFMSRGEDAGYEDFQETVTDPALKISQALGTLIVDSELGPRIAYEMATDPKEARKVSQMSAVQQAAWFGRREAQLSSAAPDAGAQDTARKATKSPKPLSDIEHGGSASTPATPSTNDFASFERLAMSRK